MTIKKVFHTVVNVLCVLVILAALLILLSVVLTKPGQAPNILGYSSFRVLTGSMEPTISTNSMILVKRTEPEQVKPGDVISFYSPDPSLGGAINTHRVVSVSREDGILRFSTKGDANLFVDNYTISEDAFIGIVVFSSYPLGVVIRLLSNPIVFISLILVPLLLILILNMVKTVKIAQKAAKEETEEELRSILEELQKRKDQAQSADGENSMTENQPEQDASSDEQNSKPM